MIVSTLPLRMPRTSRRSPSTATTLYCSSKIDVLVSFIWSIGCGISYQQFWIFLREPVAALRPCSHENPAPPPSPLGGRWPRGMGLGSGVL
jgi:hypothetical protein